MVQEFPPAQLGCGKFRFEMGGTKAKGRLQEFTAETKSARRLEEEEA